MTLNDFKIHYHPDFGGITTWDEVRYVMLPVLYRQFAEWMNGQTQVCGPNGVILVYADDLERFLAGGSVID